MPGIPAKPKYVQILLYSFYLIYIVALLMQLNLPQHSANAATDGVQSDAKLKSAVLSPQPSFARDGIGMDLAQGKFLVASRKLNDPNFSQTVVLLIRYDRYGASGVVINRPLTVKLSAVFPELKISKHRNEVIYFGGPVEPNKIILVVKSAKKIEKSLKIIDDVYVTSSLEELKRFTKNIDKDEKFRIYAGYAGWSPGQLDAECDRGDWHILQSDAGTLFDKKSTEIWPELIHRSAANWVNQDTDSDSSSQG